MIPTAASFRSHPAWLRTTALLAGGAVVLSACTGGSVSTTPSSDSVATADVTPADATGPTEGVTTEPAPGHDELPDDGAGTETPEESFRSWLAASREPDVDLACAYLSDGLVGRMVDEMTADGWPGITDCASMTTATAELYAAFGASDDVSLALVEQTADRAVLDVRYPSGDCGTAVMVPVGDRWVMDERTEEQC